MHNTQVSVPSPYDPFVNVPIGQEDSQVSGEVSLLILKEVSHFVQELALLHSAQFDMKFEIVLRMTWNSTWKRQMRVWQTVSNKVHCDDCDNSNLLTLR